MDSGFGPSTLGFTAALVSAETVTPDDATFSLDAATAEQLVTADSAGGQLLLLLLGHANLECVLISRDDGIG